MKNITSRNRAALYSVFSALSIISYVSAAPQADRVQALPDCGPLPSAWYSGYLPVSPTKSLHYLF